MIFRKTELNRIAKALEDLVLLQQTHLASKGLFVSLDPPTDEGEGEVMLTDLDRIVEIEAKKEKYAKEVGLSREVSEIGPLSPTGAEWPASVEEVLAEEIAQRSGSEGLLSVGPEGAEDSTGETPGGGSGENQPAGHIPR